MQEAKKEVRVPFVLDDHETMIDVVMNAKTANKRRSAFDALRVARGLNNAEVVITTPMVDVLTRFYKMDVQAALDLVREYMPQYLEQADRDALIVTVFDELFRIEIQAGRPVVLFGLPFEIGAADFDDTEENQTRFFTSVAPPLPPRKATNAVEQKLAYIKNLLNSNPVMAGKFVQTFENWFANEAQVFIDEKRALEAVDSNGFRSGDVGGDPHAQDSANG